MRVGGCRMDHMMEGQVGEGGRVGWVREGMDLLVERQAG